MWTESLPSYTSECLLVKAHVLEAFIDMLLTKEALPLNWAQQLEQCQGKVHLHSSEILVNLLTFF